MPEQDPPEAAMSNGVWTVDQLRRAETVGHRVDFLFFWGHTGSPGSAVGPHVLSQWFPNRFELDGWGIGLAADSPAAQRPSEWPGLNLLGLALMQARAQLRT